MTYAASSPWNQPGNWNTSFPDQIPPSPQGWSPMVSNCVVVDDTGQWPAVDQPHDNDRCLVVTRPGSNLETHLWGATKAINNHWSAWRTGYTDLSGNGFDGTGCTAAGTSYLGGLIRTADVEPFTSTQPFPFALQMVLGNYALKRGFVSPATSEDSPSQPYGNVVNFPIGSRVMLDPTTYLPGIVPWDMQLQKVCRTLMTFGAIVVDAGWDTPFMIRTEQSAASMFRDYNSFWMLDEIRKRLRRVA